MKTQFESPPYDHTCPECGREQQVHEYDADPIIDIGKVETSPDGGEWILPVVIDPRRKFRCVACGYARNFDSSPIKTGLKYEVGMGYAQSIEQALFIARQKAKSEIEDPEEYL